MSSLTYIATKRSVVSRSMPRPNRCAYCERLVAVLEPDADRLREHRRDVGEPVAEVAPGDVDAERQRQARLALPPLAEVEHLVEPRACRR